MISSFDIPPYDVFFITLWDKRRQGNLFRPSGKFEKFFIRKGVNKWLLIKFIDQQIIWIIENLN